MLKKFFKVEPNFFKPSNLKYKTLNIKPLDNMMQLLPFTIQHYYDIYNHKEALRLQEVEESIQLKLAV